MSRSFIECSILCAVSICINTRISPLPYLEYIGLEGMTSGKSTVNMNQQLIFVLKMGCGEAISGGNAGNLQQHCSGNTQQCTQKVLRNTRGWPNKFRWGHNEIKPPKDIRISLTPWVLTDTCTELITLNGGSFLLIEDCGFGENDRIIKY